MEEWKEYQLKDATTVLGDGYMVLQNMTKMELFFLSMGIILLMEKSK